MKIGKGFLCRSLTVVFAVVVIIGFSAASVSSQTIIEEWGSVKVPAAPAVRPVKIDPASTALLLLDFNKQVCNEKARPRCIASIPAVKGLLDGARENKVSIIYSLTIGSSTADIAKDLAPREGDPVVTSGPDKFMGTNLEAILKDRGIKSVIVTGTAAHGAVLYTAGGAALRGLQVIVPVDGMSAESTYAEQYVAWHLANAPRVSARVTMTKINLVGY